MKNEPTNPITRIVNGYPILEYIGLTKRELFAAMAMQGILSKDGYFFSEVAGHAVGIADDLIKELEKENKYCPNCEKFKGCTCVTEKNQSGAV